MKRNWLIAILIALMFIASIAAVFADDNATPIARIAGNNTFGRGNGPRPNVPPNAPSNMPNLAKLRELRQQQMTALADARERLQQFRLRFDTAIANWQTAKLRFEGRKDEYMRACRNNTNSTECADAKAKILQDSKDYIATIADRITTQLEKINASVEASEKLSDADKADITAKIDIRISNLASIKAKAQSATTKEEVQAAAKSLRDEVISMSKGLRVYAGYVVNAKIGNIADRGDRLSARLDEKLASMKAKGEDTSKVEPLVASFKASVASAKTHYANAEAKFNEAKASTDPSNDLIKQAMDEMKAGESDLKDAYNTLKDIVKAIRDAGDKEEIVPAEPPATTLAA